MNARFRLGVPDDAEVLSEFAAAVFVDWYLPDNRPEDVYDHVRDTFNPALQRAELQDTHQHVLLAEDGGRLAGYALLRVGSGNPPEAVTGMAELRRFYVARPWHGSGLARHLMQNLLGVATALAVPGVWLTCWDRNPRALAFYAKCGFRDVGTVPFTVGSDVQTDRLLCRAIGADVFPTP